MNRLSIKPELTIADSKKPMLVSRCKEFEVCKRVKNKPVVVTLDKEIRESRAYAEMSQALSIYHGEQRSIPETDDDAGDEY